MAESTTIDGDFTLEKSTALDDQDSTRTPRSSDTREATKRPINFDQQTKLPAPDPRNGIEFQYVRVNSRGQVDNMNFSDALRRGWEPVKATDYPEFGHVLSDHNSNFDDAVLIGGLILCQRDKSIGDEFRRRADAESRAQIKALDGNYMRDGGQDSRVPKFNESTSSIRFGDD